MTQQDFYSNSKLFAEVEIVRQSIREEIHNKCRNSIESPAAKTQHSSQDTSRKCSTAVSPT